MLNLKAAEADIFDLLRVDSRTPARERELPMTLQTSMKSRLPNCVPLFKLAAQI
jgi:hypothetical protein